MPRNPQVLPMAPHFGAWLMLHITAKGLTPNAFALRAGIPRTFIYPIVDGHRPPPPDYIMSMADVLGLAGRQRYEFVLLAAQAHLPEGVKRTVASAQKASGSKDWSIAALEQVLSKAGHVTRARRPKKAGR